MFWIVPGFYSYAGLIIFLFFVSQTPVNANPQDCREGTIPRLQLFDWAATADPWDIAISPDSVVFITDPANDAVCRFTLSGQPLGCWGDSGIGPGQFDNPEYIAVGTDGRVYVSDHTTRIQVFSNDGVFLFQFGNGPLDSTPGSFSGPTGPIAIDAVGNLYVSESRSPSIEGDFQNRIQKFNQDGTFLSVIAQCDDFPPQAPCSYWFHCEDLEIAEDGSIFLLDSGLDTQYHNRISRFSPSGSCEAIWGANGDQPGEFAYPSRLALNNEGHLFVTDWFRIQEWDRDGNFIIEQAWPQTWSFNAIDFFGSDSEFCYVTSGIGSIYPSLALVLGPEPLALNILNSHWLDETHALDCSDLLNLANCDLENRPMQGVSSDGVSPLLLRIDLPVAGTVQFGLSDPDLGITSGLGTLSPLCGEPTSEALTLASELVDGKNIVFAVFTSPEDFNRSEVPEDLERFSRALNVEIVFYPDGEQVSGLIQESLFIQRPPVVFVHGLWDNKGSWKDYPGDDLAGWQTLMVDYRASNGDRFDVNWPKVNTQIEGATILVTNESIVASQVDLIAHSMGGLLTRKIFESSGNASAANMGQGVFNKVLFLNVPHQGSLLANAMVELRSALKLGHPLVRLSARTVIKTVEIFKNVGLEAVLGGAIDDLSVGSQELTFDRMDVPIHAYVGTGGSDLVGISGAAVSPLAGLFHLLQRTTGLQSMDSFWGIQHDFVVGRQSQEGGLNSGDQISIGHGIPGIHDKSIKESNTGDLISSFLQTPVSDSGFFASFIPGSSSPAAPKGSSTIPDFAGEVIYLNTGAGSINPGQTVSCTIHPIGDRVIQEAYVIHPEGLVILEEEPFSGSFSVPMDAIGTYPVSGLALLSDGALARSNQVVLQIELGTTSVDSISVNPESLHFSNPGSLFQIGVLGHFDDGVSRDIGGADYWMNYSSFNHSVIQVDESGLVQAIGPGETTLRVRLHEPDHYSIDVLVPVSVEDGPLVNNPPHASAGGPYTFCADRELCLDASSSYDYDTLMGDDLSFSWDLNGDGAFDDAIGPTPCIIFPSAATPDLVGLRVTDTNGLVSEDYAEINPEFTNCHDGIFICQVDEAGEPSEPFTRLEAIAHTPDGGFFLLNYPNQFQWTNPAIHKFTASCGYEFTIHPDFSPRSFFTDSDGTLNIRHELGPNWELVRYSIEGNPMPTISMGSISADMLSSRIDVDGAGNIYSSHSQWEGGPFGPSDTFLDRFNSQGQLLESINLDDLLGIENVEYFSVTPEGSFFTYGDFTVAFVQRENDEYILGASWGEEGEAFGQFDWVRDLTTGPDNVVYVGENNRVQLFSHTGEFLGQRTGSGGPNSPISIDRLEKISVNTSGTIFAATHLPSTVQVFRFESDGLSSVWEDHESNDQTSANGRPVLVLFASKVNLTGSNQIIEFSTSRSIPDINLRVFDLRGRLVRELNFGPVEPGRHLVQWDTRDHRGAQTGSGIYLLQLEGGGFVTTGKTILIR